MKKQNDPLNRILKKSTVPEMPEDYWQNFPKDVVRRIRAEQESSTEGTPGFGRNFAAWSWGLGWAAAACLIFIFGKSTLSPRVEDTASQARIYHEIAALFPNQVRAIVIKAGETHLVLSDKPDIARSTPLLLKICNEQQCQEVITFSGQQAQIDGETCDVLCDHLGNVIISGSRFFWSSSESERKSGKIHIQAQTLKI